MAMLDYQTTRVEWDRVKGWSRIPVFASPTAHLLPNQSSLFNLNDQNVDSFAYSWVTSRTSHFQRFKLALARTSPLTHSRLSSKIPR
ncbi:hypothetical protein B0J17DRAFT_106532 [Rhizoctonia solani]|nr:hypothetical protein B0J17DRAFT_106532 [Rhizoctonia solani]